MIKPNAAEGGMLLFAFVTAITLIIDGDMFSSRNGLDIYESYLELFGSEKNVVIASVVCIILYSTLLFINGLLYRFAVNLYGFVYIACNAATYFTNYPTMGLAWALFVIVMAAGNLFLIVSLSEEKRKLKEQKKVIEEYEKDIS
ncbi:hypothetical protein [Macrococcus brunensis]|uniref:hypothetical protein n=1 Tax=Macrococcus brunensis TaxID=198483 RepID=UPI001EF137A5|nr:hypothetical protein [Macrococcus brunensis]ULG73229.1 hypothetical protein MGG13_05745 [Macrococcus brunensis]